MHQQEGSLQIHPVSFPGSELPRGYFCGVTPP